MDDFGTDPKKLVRRNDPETSYEAAEAVDSSRLEREVYEAIATFGDGGCTSDELRGKYFAGYSYSSVTARYKALFDKGLIEIIGKRKGNSGRNQRVMRKTKLNLDGEERCQPQCQSSQPQQSPPKGKPPVPKQFQSRLELSAES